MPGVLRCLHLIAQRGMIAFLDTQDGVKTVGVQGLKVGSSGTQAVFGNNALEVGMILAQLGHEALGGIPFPIIFVRAIVPDLSV
jgi:hypothetical protein